MDTPPGSAHTGPPERAAARRGSSRAGDGPRPRAALLPAAGVTATLLVAILTAGCSATPAGQAPPSATATSTSAAGPSAGSSGAPVDEATLAAYQRRVQAAAEENVGALLTGGARPTVELRDGRPEAVSLQDVDETSYAAGTYHLTTYCAGTARLSVSFAMGGDHARGELTCSPQIASTTVRLQLTERAAGVRVTIEPQDASPAAVSYVISAQ